MNVMVFGAGAFILVGLGLVFVGAGAKKRRPKDGPKPLPPEPPKPPEEEPIIRWEAEEWFMPEGWLEVYGTPRMREYVFPRHEAGEEIDALDVTLYLLDGQINGFPLPAAAHPPEGEMWQADVPTTVNYYNGPESVLGLLYHVAEYVEEGLGRWQAGDDLYLAELGLPEEGG